MSFEVGINFLSHNVTEPDDIDYRCVLMPIKRIVTRERGLRQDISRLTKAYQQSPEKIPPPVVDARGDGKFLVIDGHHRLRAAKNAGLESMWVISLGEKHKHGSKTPCTCGHPRGYHNGSIMFDGHGSCSQPDCKCPQFVPASPMKTWNYLNKSKPEIV